MIGACYIRVSTDDQTEYSPDAQINAIKDYCKKNDIILPNEFIFRDEGISGRRADKRPAFMEMIKKAKTKPKPFDVILVHKFDRFARSREDSIVYKSLLKRECGIKVVSITENIEDDKFGVILEGMLESMAEYYSLNLADEVKKGLIEKAHRGEVCSKAPFGYTNKNKTVIKNENAEIVKMVFEKFVFDNFGYQKLAKLLNDLNIKTIRGNKWELRMVKYMLKNPIYCGYTRWCPIRHDTHHYMFDKSIIVKSNFDPIISKELYDKAKDKINHIESISRKYAKLKDNKIWINNLIYCEHCGKALTQITKGIFQCCGYNKGICTHSQYVKTSVLEEVILTQLKLIFDKKLEVMYINTEKENNEFSILKTQLDKTLEKEIRIKEAYRNGIDTLEEYKDNKEKVYKEKVLIELKIKEALKDDKIEVEKKLRENAKTIYEILKDDKIDINKKYDYVHIIIEKCIFNKQEKKLAIYFRKEYTKSN
jgi:DNA invertase Pin-like site-specific DNA recombinase